MSTNEDTLGRFWWLWFIITKFVSLHEYVHNPALVDVQALRFGRVDQFVS
jgi:hypothetical protein